MNTRKNKRMTTVIGTCSHIMADGQVWREEESHTFFRPRYLTVAGAERLVRRERPGFVANRAEYAIFGK